MANTQGLDDDPCSFERSDMAAPEEALAAYERLRAAAGCPVRLTRRGKPLTIEYQIK